MSSFLRPIEARFWEKVSKLGPDDCWLWTAGRHSGGYGHLGLGRAGAGNVKAHRFSYELHHGPIPDGMFVCHSCDNPPCVNPAHLSLGTPADNMRDRKERGRATGGRAKGTVPSGEQSPNAKLTEGMVREILRSTASGASLARRFGVRDTTISRIRSGKTWSHINEQESPP